MKGELRTAVSRPPAIQLSWTLGGPYILRVRQRDGSQRRREYRWRWLAERAMKRAAQRWAR